MNKKILIVDDEEMWIDIFKERMKDESFTIITASDGYSAVKMLENNPDTSLIIIDFMLPNLDGIKAARLIKYDKRFASIPVILFTVRAFPDTEERAKDVKIDLILYKNNIDWDGFKEKIKEIIKNGQKRTH